MLPFSVALRLSHILCSITCQFANMISLCVYSAALCLPHILCNSACLSCRNGFCVYLSLARRIYCSRLGRAKGTALSHILCSITCQFANMISLCVYSAALRLPHILCNSACLSCKNGFCVYSAALRLPHILFTSRQLQVNLHY